jgi:hypothetical protein
MEAIEWGAPAGASLIAGTLVAQAAALDRAPAGIVDRRDQVGPAPEVPKGRGDRPVGCSGREALDR